MTIAADSTMIVALPRGECWLIVDPRLAAEGLLHTAMSTVARNALLRTRWLQAGEPRTAAQLAGAAVAAQADRVVALADDRTIRAVALALANTGVPLGIVPIGSGRHVAHSWCPDGPTRGIDHGP